MKDPLKPEDLYGTCDARQGSRGNLRQDLERLMQDLRSTISDVFGGRKAALRSLRDDANFQRQYPEYDRGFAMQDMFDLSLTWDDLKFLRRLTFCR